MRWLLSAGLGGALLFCGGLRAASGGAAGSETHDVVASESAGPFLIDQISFFGLRRIAPSAVLAQLSSRAGTLLDAGKIQSDVKALGRLGWFEQVQAEIELAADSAYPGAAATPHVHLLFHVEERPFLANVEFTGSRLLSPSQIEKILSEKHLTPSLGEPVDEYRLNRVGRAIQGALAELAHPQATVQMERTFTPHGTVRVRYEIDDGPHLPVGKVDFVGHPEISARALRSEMHWTAPGGLFASWRGKGAFTTDGWDQDRARILVYYHNHGFPGAQVGTVQTSIYEHTARRWLPWPRHQTDQRLAMRVPVEAGRRYHVKAIVIAPELQALYHKRTRKLMAYSAAQAGSAYSAKALDDLRHAWLVAARPKDPAAQRTAGSVQVVRSFDPSTHEVLVRIGPGDAPPLVRRMEFLGQHRFPDRYLRRRIGLQEGQPLDERSLEAGLARLTKTGYFRQMRKEDIRVEEVEGRDGKFVDVKIRVSEAGQQRAAFSGGHEQFGNTLGLVYSLFDVLQREELLSAHLDAGPQSLQLALGLVMEGFLGSRSSLAMAVFDDVVRPRFVKTVRGPFYTSQSEGWDAGWSYPLGPADTLSVNYRLARSNTDYASVLPPSLTGLPTPNLTAATSSSAAGIAFDHNTGSNHIVLANSVSGGLLGGNENVLRSDEQYARIFPDPIFHQQGAWAFRATVSGAGSYQGEMPLYARLFSGDAQVRGLSSGQLGPYAVTPVSGLNGAQTYTALPAGANVVSAANAEYRVPLRSGVQAAGFFDFGSGWLLPNWLGPTKPLLLPSTNGVLHGSAGIELRWTVPEIQVPVRVYVAVNVFRLNRFLALPNGTLFHAHEKLFALGWALGNLF